MRERWLTVVFYFVLAGGVVLVVCAYALPLFKSVQTIDVYGPATPYGNSSSQITGYFFPPIDAGQQITVNFSSYKTNSITFSFFPSEPDSFAPTGTPLIFQPALQTPEFRTVLTSPATQAYGLYVTSLNRSAYRVQVRSVWSPYYTIRGYVPEGVFLILLGTLGAIYYRIARQRVEMFQKALDELAARKSGAN